jgi:hypothetical protein
VRGGVKIHLTTMKITAYLTVALVTILHTSCSYENQIPTTPTQDLNPKLGEIKKGSTDSVQFVATHVSGEYLVKISGKPMGIHENKRGESKICGSLNSTQTWLVVEDGCGGDSYPKVTAYKLTHGKLLKSVEMERIDKEHHYRFSQRGGVTDPVFLGFDPTGAPTISSATGIHTLGD